MSAGYPADESEKRDWDVPSTETREEPGHHEPEAEPSEDDAAHPTVHGETPDQSERRDWDVP